MKGLAALVSGDSEQCRNQIHTVQGAPQERASFSPTHSTEALIGQCRLSPQVWISHCSWTFNINNQEPQILEKSFQRKESPDKHQVPGGKGDVDKFLDVIEHLEGEKK